MTKVIDRDRFTPLGEPHDGRRPPRRLTLQTNIEGRWPCDVVVIGVSNNATSKMQVDLIQVLEPGLPLKSQKDWTLLRAAIEEGAEAQGYHVWGFTRSMVDGFDSKERSPYGL